MGSILYPVMSQGNFHTTRWTMIRSARAKDEPGSAAALAGLCEAYWYPLYVFVRRMGKDAEDAYTALAALVADGFGEL